MHPLRNLFRSTVGLKVIMAVSGLGALVWLLLHMLGNLQVFPGPGVINHYAAILHGSPALLWGQRVGFFGALLVHVVAATKLMRIQSAARPVAYHARGNIQASLPSRTMRITGPLIGVFLVYHLLHFTIGSLHPSFSHSDVFRNVEVAFSSWGTAVLYVLVAGIVGFHLVHGTRSVLSSVGVDHPVYARALRRGLGLLAVVIALGLGAVPVGAYLGLTP